MSYALSELAVAQSVVAGVKAAPLFSVALYFAAPPSPA